MRIAERLRQGGPSISFEFFPPKDAEAVARLFGVAKELASYKPTFVSVTYGAGGSTRDLTIELVTRIKGDVGLETMAHLTCVGHTASELGEVLDQLRDAGIENVLTLRGDPPKGQTKFTPTPGGFSYAQELTRFTKARYAFCLGGAAYPEVHLEAKDADADLMHLKEKVDSGAEFLITQLFFDPTDYFAFVERARAIGIGVPIIPGIMPVTNVAQIKRFTQLCGSRIPEELQSLLDGVKDDESGVVAVGVAWATAQCKRLLAGGAPGIHFYTLNRARAARMVLDDVFGTTSARAPA